MKKLKKILKITLITLIVLIGLLFAAPYLFKSQIVAFVKKQVNENLAAKVDFTDVDISFFRHFPKVAVALEGLSVAGINEFDGDTLIAAKKIDAAVNIMSVIKGKNMTIYSVSVDEPRIHAIVHKNGKANWDITKPDSSQTVSTGEEKPFEMSLQSYTISNGYLSYQDEPGNMSAEISGLDHSGSGDFTSDLFTLATQTKARSVSFVYEGIPYLAQTATNIDADIQVDNKQNKYSFKTDQVSLNELKLSTEGFFQLVNDSTYNMDVRFNAPSTDFKNILSLVPVVYQKDFKNIKTSGEALFNGFVKGTYSEKQMPAYSINLGVKNGFFQYPDLPKPVKNINLSMKVDNPDGVTDHTVVDIPKAHLELDNDPFDFRLLVKNPVSNMYVDAAAKGKLDLSKITQLVKLEEGTRLNGLLDADVTINGNVDAIQQQQFDKFNAGGTIDLSNFFYASKAYPDGVKLDKLQSTFNPKNVILSNVTGSYLKTNFSANGQINNLLAYALKDQPLDGLLNVKADRINLNDWMGISADTAASAPANTGKTAESQPFAVPSNIRFVVNAAADEVKYDKLILNQLSGSLKIADEAVQLNNVKANALDGSMTINGSYSTALSRKKPDITLNYDVKDLNVEKTFYTFNTVQKLMPIGQFIAGKLNSQLTMKGKLGDNMMPDLSSLTGNGNLLLIEGFLSKFKPLEQLAQTLDIKELDKISVRDVKNYIEFTDGKVMVKPFKVKVKDVEMEIGGFHGFDQSMDYTINMKVPRALMGEKGNSYVNNLISQVNSKGVPVKLGDLIPIQARMGGTIRNPTIRTDLKQTAGSLADDMKKQVVDFAKAKVDSTRTAVTTAVKDSIESAKKQVIKTAEEELKKQLLGKKDSTASQTPADTKKKLEETGKGLIKNILGKKKKDSTPGGN